MMATYNFGSVYIMDHPNSVVLNWQEESINNISHINQTNTKNRKIYPQLKSLLLDSLTS